MSQSFKGTRHWRLGSAPAAETKMEGPMVAVLKSFLNDDRGVTSIEYVLLASLIAVAIVGICTSTFSKLSAEYGEISASYN